MFYTLSKSLWDVGIPSIPLFRTSKLPAIPTEKIAEANKALFNSSWRSAHQDKALGVPMGIVLPNDKDNTLIALALDNSLGDLKIAAQRKLPPGYWTVTNTRHTYLIFKCPVAYVEPSMSYFLPGRNQPICSVLSGNSFLKLHNHLQLPTLEMLEGLPSVSTFDFVAWLSEEPQGHEVYSEPCKLDSQQVLTSLGQLDVKMRIYITHFLHDFLINSTEKASLLPVLQEIEALYDSFSASFKHIPPNYQKDTYFQAFYGLFYEQKMMHSLLLPPNWSEGIGTQYREKYNIPFQKRDTQHKFEQLRENTFLSMSEAVGSDQKMLQSCQKAIEEIARSLTITKMEEDQLKRYISRQSGMKLNMNKMASQITQHRNKYLGRTDLTTIIQRVLAFLTYQTEYRYDPSRNSQGLFRWNGVHWELVEDFELINIINTYFPSDLTARNGKNMRNIVTSVKSQLTMPLRRVATTGVNFKNGFVSTSLEVLNHDPDMGLTYALPFVFDPGRTEPPPLFGKFLNELWGHAKNNILALQEALAATFFNTTTIYQHAFLLHGPPNSGKTQLLNIIKGLVPTSMRVSVPPEAWSDRESISALTNKLLNLCGELSENMPINSQRFKDVVDGNEITLVKSVDSHVALNPVTAHWFASNHLPKTKDFSEGFTRRWLIFPTTKVFKDDEVVVDIGNRIVNEEKDAIISWALQGYLRLMEQSSYTRPEGHDALASELGQMNNNVRFFMENGGSLSFPQGNMINVLRSLPRDELIEELETLPYVTGRDLYTLYQACTKAFKKGGLVDEAEFYRRTRELSSTLGFMQIVGRDENQNPAIRYYGILVSKN